MVDQVKHCATRETVTNYIKEKFGAAPEYLWEQYPFSAVFRRHDNRKWFAVIMDIQMNKLGLEGHDKIDILDIKCDDFVREIYLKKQGFIPAYHLNKDNWITVLLDGTVDTDILFGLIDASYEIAKCKSKKAVRHAPTDILVPVNPKYYDIEKAFAESDTILWKQSSSVIVGDTIYLYVAAPYSCILYKCVAEEVNIPYEYDDGNIRMKTVMKIRRLHTYDKTAFEIDTLKKYGIVSVRGPRSIPNRLRHELENSSTD